MAKKEEGISKEEARQQVLSIVHRLALIHYSYARTLIEELGEKRGKQIIRKAIQRYGEQVGKSVREKTLAKGLKPLQEYYQEDLPSLAWSVERVRVDGEPRARSHACPLADVWKGLGATELGRMYCYVDQAKYEAYNPNLVCIHEKNMLDGDPYCELAVRSKRTSTKE